MDSTASRIATEFSPRIWGLGSWVWDLGFGILDFLSIASCSSDFCFSGLFIRLPGIYRSKSRQTLSGLVSSRHRTDPGCAEARAAFWRAEKVGLVKGAQPVAPADQGFAIHPLTPVGLGIYSPHEPPGRRQILRVRGSSKKNEFLPRYEKKQAFYPAGLCRAGLVIG
jgi:hypothetical protein